MPSIQALRVEVWDFAPNDINPTFREKREASAWAYKYGPESINYAYTVGFFCVMIAKIVSLVSLFGKTLF